jgi:hypothetical protein
VIYHYCDLALTYRRGLTVTVSAGLIQSAGSLAYGLKERRLRRRIRSVGSVRSLFALQPLTTKPQHVLLFSIAHRLPVKALIPATHTSPTKTPLI